MQDHNHLKIDITRSSTPPVDNFRVNAIRSDYDYTVPEVTEHFTGEIILPNDWQIGVIVGPAEPVKPLSPENFSATASPRCRSSVIQA